MIHELAHVVQGGSTLTQQLTKNLYLSPKRSVIRKAREAMMALTLEGRHTILKAFQILRQEASPSFGAGKNQYPSCRRLFQYSQQEGFLQPLGHGIECV